MNMPPLLLAIEPGGVVGLIFFVIAAIGWISNLINGENKKAEPSTRKPVKKRERDSRVNQELEAFLKEATGKRQNRQEVSPQGATPTSEGPAFLR